MPRTPVPTGSRDNHEFLLFSISDRSQSSIARFLGDEVVRRESSPSPGVFNVQEASLPFARSTVATSGRDRVFIGTNDTYEIREFSLDGALERIVRRTDVTPPEVTTRTLEQYVEVVAEARGWDRDHPQRVSLRSGILELPRVPSMPVYSGILADETGALWVRDYAPPWNMDRNQSWTVFAPGGQLVARVEMPPEFRAHQIGADFVLGVATDDLGVERVRLYDLSRRE